MSNLTISHHLRPRTADDDPYVRVVGNYALDGLRPIAWFTVGDVSTFATVEQMRQIARSLLAEADRLYLESTAAVTAVLDNSIGSFGEELEDLTPEEDK